MPASRRRRSIVSKSEARRRSTATRESRRRSASSLVSRSCRSQRRVQVPAGSAAATEPAVDIDPVHAALGEIEAARLSNRGFEVHLDEPYQHYQHAGRGDLVAFDRKHRALLHIENRTRFPDIQGFAGSYNAKRAYLAPELADRWQLGGGFSSQTHIVAALWSAEVLTTLRLREATFRALCPQSPEGFAAWWEGDPAAPTPRGSTSALVLLDSAGRRARIGSGLGRSRRRADRGSPVSWLRTRSPGSPRSRARLTLGGRIRGMRKDRRIAEGSDDRRGSDDGGRSARIAEGSDDRGRSARMAEGSHGWRKDRTGGEAHDHGRGLHRHGGGALGVRPVRAEWPARPGRRAAACPARCSPLPHTASSHDRDRGRTWSSSAAAWPAWWPRTSSSGRATDPIVLEAQNRVGGRVYTLRTFAPGPVRGGRRDAHPARARPDARVLPAVRAAACGRS